MRSYLDLFEGNSLTIGVVKCLIDHTELTFAFEFTFLIPVLVLWHNMLDFIDF